MQTHVGSLTWLKPHICQPAAAFNNTAYEFDLNIFRFLKLLSTGLSRTLVELPTPCRSITRKAETEKTSPTPAHHVDPTTGVIQTEQFQITQDSELPVAIYKEVEVAKWK